MFNTSVIEISESALRNNIDFLRALISPKVKFSSVIKGNAYGHGIELFLPLAEKCGLKHFAVFNAAEALRAFKSKTQDSEIMIMGDLPNDEIEWAVENDISFYIFNLHRLEAAKRVAEKLKKPAKIHLELETGLNRTGLIDEALEKTVEVVKKNGNLFQVEGVCTHYAGAETMDNYLRIKNQIETFRLQTEWLRKKGVDFKSRHSACSAAAFAFPETKMDMVRFGIAQYGYWPSQETRVRYYVDKGINPGDKMTDPLRRVIKWKSRIMNIKKIYPGEFVGYGSTFLTTREKRVAAIPVGYFHGFARSLSNLGKVLIHGKRVPVVGMVNMNMMMVDVTGVTNPKIGDEVVIIGKQKKLQISVASFSDMTNYLNYEVLVSLPSEIPRKVVN